MPLRCLDGETAIHAFDLSADAWKALAEDNRKRRHLRMPCCQALVTLNRSRLGTQFFRHKAVGACTTAPETEAHLRLKRLAVEVARAHGWQAWTEVASGTAWRADVLATKGDERVAIEIQWSQQSDEETLRRQQHYAASGVRGLWLLRQSRFARDAALPAARVSMSEDGHFLAHVSGQTMSAEAFIGAALSARLHYGLPLALPATATINAGEMSCWDCGADTPIISSIALSYGPNDIRLSVAEFDAFPDLFALVRKQIPEDAGIGIIRPRFSRTMNRAYLSNGCAHCDVLIGQHYEHEAWYREKTVAAFSVLIDEAWRRLLRPRSAKGWGVFSLETESISPQAMVSRR